MTDVTEKQGACIVYTDGGARGNPGPSAAGGVIVRADGVLVAKISEYLGIATNNVAEYSGLIAALEYAAQHRLKALKVLSDSELLVRQINGEYKVKAPALQELYARARKLIRELNWFAIEHIRREGNKEADRLANLAMDEGKKVGN